MLWRYFSMPQETVTVTASGAEDARGRELDAVLAECRAMRDEMARLRPRTGKEQVAHYLLMLDIRIEYLRFKRIEARYQSADFHRRDIPALKHDLEALVRSASKIDKRFALLHAGYLKPAEIDYLNRMRTLKMRSLHERLKSDR